MRREERRSRSAGERRSKAAAEEAAKASLPLGIGEEGADAPAAAAGL
jgi:hypothetical protein